MLPATRWFLCICILSLFAGAACAGEPTENLGEPGERRPDITESGSPGNPENENDPRALDDFTADSVRTLLADRLFTQFTPKRDSDRRKAVTLDFSDGFALRAQYAEYGHAVNEWRITADDYTVEMPKNGSVVTLYPITPRTRHQFPTECDDCIDTTGVSVSVKNLAESDRMEFRVNDPEDVLPSPFPVFIEWTKFREPELMN